MFYKDIAVVTVTRSGIETARKIKAALEEAGLCCSLYVPRKYAYVPEATLFDGPVRKLIAQVFNGVSAIVAVMATGVVVRAVAPLLKNKLSDPAVVCVDVAGRFAVSLLSGHYGGANQLARLIAVKTSAVPVITTATEALGKISVEELARCSHCRVVNPESLVNVNAAIVDGKQVAIIAVGCAWAKLGKTLNMELQEAESLQVAAEIVGKHEAGIVFIEEEECSVKFTKPTALLKPLCIAVGLGARKNVAANHVASVVKDAMHHVGLPVTRANCLATIDLKKDAEAILETAGKLGLPLRFFSAEELGAVRYDDLSHSSEIVERRIGVGGVCERAALLAAGKNAKLILKKTRAHSVTVAVAEGE
jgi:cobalt-precorrin 5A hydrolase